MNDVTTGIRKVSLDDLASAVASNELDELSLLWLPNVAGRTVFGKLLERRTDGTEALIAYNAFEDLEAAAKWLARHGIESAALLIEPG